MLFNKPKDIRYVEMCQIIDEQAYTGELSDDKLFEYLYLIMVMLARTQNFFKRGNYLDDFGVYAATTVFLRYKNPKQFELDEEGNPLLPKIKGVLNYSRRVSYPLKVQFEQREYCQIYSKQPETEEDAQASEYLFSDMIADSIDSLSSVDFETSLGNIIETAEAFLKKLPYYPDKVMWINIYASCMLTFLNSITMTNRNIERLNNLQHLSEEKINLTYRRDGEDCVILYHLPEKYHNYIHVLTKELKHAIAKDLSLNLHTYIPAESGMRQLVINELAGINSGDMDQ